MRAWPVVLILFGGLGLAAFGGVGRSPLPAMGGGDGTAPVFMSFAVGDVVDRVSVRTEPGGGDTVAVLAAGTRVGIGGQVTFGGAWARGVAYWVAAEADGHTVLGFVPAGGVDIRAGNPPLLTLEGAAIGPANGGASAPDGGAAQVEPASPPALRGRARSGEDTVQAASVENAMAGRVEAPAAAPGTTVAIPWLPAPVRAWSDLLDAAAATHGVAADLLAIITLVESGGHPSARSHVGATGLMQVMPPTAADIARQRGMGAFDAARLNDPAVAIDFGAWYLAQQLKAFGQSDDPDWARSVTLAAAAYNGGPGTAMRYQRGGGLPSETQHYIDWVGGMWRERADAASPTYERWLAAGGSVLVDKAQAWLEANDG